MYDYDDNNYDGSSSKCGFNVGARGTFALGHSSFYTGVGADYSLERYEIKFDRKNNIKFSAGAVEVPLFIGVRTGDPELSVGAGIGPMLRIGTTGEWKELMMDTLYVDDTYSSRHMNRVSCRLVGELWIDIHRISICYTLSMKGSDYINPYYHRWYKDEDIIVNNALSIGFKF